MNEVVFFKKEDLKVRSVLKSSQLRVVANEHSMISLFDFGPDDEIIPVHKHPHEQISYILAGSVKMIAGGKTKILKKGQGAVIPPNVEHEIIALEKGSQVLDVFYPLREEYLT